MFPTTFLKVYLAGKEMTPFKVKIYQSYKNAHEQKGWNLPLLKGKHIHNVQPDTYSEHPDVLTCRAMIFKTPQKSEKALRE